MIDVQDIGVYGFCSRLLYLKKIERLSEPATSDVIKRRHRTAAGRAISLGHASLFSFATSTEMSYGAIMSLLYPHSLATEVSEWALGCVKSLSISFENIVGQMGLPEAKKLVSPISYGLICESQNLGIRCTVDRINLAGAPCPVLIRCSDFKIPRENDILQALAIWSCLKEADTETGPPFIERCGTFMTHQILPTEKRIKSLNSAIEGIRLIYDGLVPSVCPHGIPRKCHGCSMEEQCYSI